MAILKQNKIGYHRNELVDNVLDADKTGTCPFEKAAAEISEPEKAYKTFRAMLEKMKARQ
jgi:hypothetical protein